MSDTPVSVTETAAPATPATVVPTPPTNVFVRPTVVPPVAKSSVFRRFIARLSSVEKKLIHDPVVDKAGKGLVAALVIRGLIALGAGAGVVSVVEHALHAAGI